MFENLGPTLRQYRKQRGIGLNQMAEKVSVSPSYLSYLETTKTDTVNLKVLSQIISLLEIPKDCLYDSNSINLSDPSIQSRIDFLTDKLSGLANKDLEGTLLIINQIESGIRLMERQTEFVK